MRPSSAHVHPPAPRRAITLPAESAQHARDGFSTWVNGVTTTSQLRRALRLFCKEARERQMRPEEMLVAFKTVCRSVPEAAGWRGDAADDLIARAVTICIEEFYGVSDREVPADDAAAT